MNKSILYYQSELQNNKKQTSKIYMATKGGNKYRELRYTVPSEAVNVQNQKSKYFKTKAEAPAALRAITSSIDADTYSEPSKMTLSQWHDIWLSDYVKDLVKYATHKKYKSMVETHIKPAMISGIRLK